MDVSTVRVVTTPLSRRTFLGAVLATSVGCAVQPKEPVPPQVSVSALLASQPFYVAHRGGGGDWPEMTAYAYDQASRIPGLMSMEVSVCLSSDGVLVCSHDPSTRRVTGAPYLIAETPWTTLSQLEVSARFTVDPSQPARPLTRFDEVVSRYRVSHVLFVEPKVSAAVGPLFSALQDSPSNRVVWKQPINSTVFARAKQQGFATWGYVLNEPSHLGANLTRYAASPDVDVLGAPVGEDDAFIGAVVAAARDNGKRVISWPVSSPSDRARLQALGVDGLMTSNPAELVGPPR